MGLGVFALFFIARGILTLLTWVSPLLLIATLVINRRVITDYIKWIWNKIKTRWPVGILLAIFSIVGFPLVAAFLFFKALVKNKMDQLQPSDEEATFVPFEELPTDDLDISEPPGKKIEEFSEYEDLFE